VASVSACAGDKATRSCPDDVTVEGGGGGGWGERERQRRQGRDVRRARWVGGGREEDLFVFNDTIEGPTSGARAPVHLRARWSAVTLCMMM
jgi:hypothetical protein